MSTKPEPEVLDEAAIAEDERALERQGSPIDLMQIPRLLGGALTDLRAIADGMANLPKILVSLNGIGERVESLDAEVKRMRAAVEAMGGDLGEVQQGIKRLEPHLEDVSRVTHPIRRINARRGRGAAG